MDKAFRNYKSGVFDQCGQIEGGHAIKIVGWGVMNSTELTWQQEENGSRNGDGGGGSDGGSGVSSTSSSSSSGGGGSSSSSSSASADTKPYWIIANSWSAEWGDGGYFLFERGANLCAMEADCAAGLPSTAGH